MQGLHDTISIAIVARDPLARGGLAALVLELEWVEIIGESRRIDEALDRPELRGADLFVWDAGLDAADQITEIADGWPGTCALLALVSDDASAAALWRAGARGILPRDAATAKVASAIAAIGAGLSVVDRSLAEAISLVAEPADRDDVELLTTRELEVVRLVAEGLSNKMIADRLGISEHTAKFHVNAILTKLGAHSRTEAVTRAARGGLIQL